MKTWIAVTGMVLATALPAALPAQSGSSAPVPSDETIAALPLEQRFPTLLAYGRYFDAFEVIERIITGQRRFLIEALALEVGKALTTRFPQITRAEITVRKPNAPVRGVLDHVEVTVVWPS